MLIRFTYQQVVVCLVSGMLLLLATSCFSRPSETRPTDAIVGSAESTKPIAPLTPPSTRPIATPGNGFTSSDACKECHKEQYASWHHSFHRRMTQVASPESVIGNFDTEPVLAYGREFALSQRRGEYWVSMQDPDAVNSADAAPVDRQVVLTTGSHHMQIYWYATGESRVLAQLPVAWLRETQQWVPTSSLFISPSPQPLRSGKRRWNEVCIKCHTTNGRPRIHDGEPDADTQVAEFGISCEACHGPGEAHVAHQRSQPAGSALDQPEVVHPLSLDHRRSAQLCGQCHGNWLAKDREGLDSFLWDGSSFRAGEELSDKGHVFGVGQSPNDFISEFLSQRPHYFDDRFWPDGMTRVSGSEYNGMARSPCFIQGEMSCVSCHKMHQAEDDRRSPLEWADDQLKRSAEGKEACLQCHTEFRSRESMVAHSHHQFDSSGNECYNCHMPHTTYGLLKAIRSHQVSTPTVQESLEAGRPNACNLCHLDKTLAWTAEQLETWYEIPRPEKLTPDQEQYAASVLWCLTGDAGQRAITAWSLGWQPAQEASGTDWMAPILAQLLMDPYDAVRHISHRSLRTLRAFESFEFSFVASQEQRSKAAVVAFRLWSRGSASIVGKGKPAVLVSENGELMREEFSRLNRLRDNREVLLAE